ncbi:MAG TPA: hypothetical protein VN421_03325 [Pseudoflavonifractor sp.]|nr:hypothetical protein [Pseudoflavonifractor sp.]
MTNTYTWTTAKGAAIEATITVTHITTETVDADGYKVDVKCDRWQRTVDSITVNGNATKLRELWNEKGTACLLIDRIGKDRLLIVIPTDVVTAIYGEEREVTARRIKAARAADAEYTASYNRIKKAMAE